MFFFFSFPYPILKPYHTTRKGFALFITLLIGKKQPFSTSSFKQSKTQIRKLNCLCNVFLFNLRTATILRLETSHAHQTCLRIQSTRSNRKRTQGYHLPKQPLLHPGLLNHLFNRNNSPLSAEKLLEGSLLSSPSQLSWAKSLTLKMTLFPRALKSGFPSLLWLPLPLPPVPLSP